MEFYGVRLESEDRVTRITLARPEKRNALSLEVLQNLIKALESVPSESAVVVLDAEGKAFSSGHDMSEMIDRPEFEPLHQLSTIGAYILGAGFLMTAGYLIASFKRKADAPANPWGGTTLEWQCSSPPPYYNFATPPVVTQGPYDGYEDLVYDEKIKGYVPKPQSA